ncbi:MAG: restriction endonuclease subunit S [Clostridium sp.]|nr:restriction endonuclease subunit S [Clostridium sp.]
MKYERATLTELLQPKGYIRGPFGSALKRKELLSTGIPVYEQQHAIYGNRNFRFYISKEKLNEMKRFQVQEDDLIISCSGTVGKVSIIRKDDPKGIISQALLLLRVDKRKIIPQYLKYFFDSAEGYNTIVSRSSGSVQVNLAKREVIENIPIFIPDIETQQKVISILTLMDKKIENNQQINDNLPSHRILKTCRYMVCGGNEEMAKPFSSLWAV